MTRGQRWCLFLILGVAAAARFIGITYCLPQTYGRPDEDLVIRSALSFFDGDFNPRHFNYPGLWPYLLHFAFRVVHAAGCLFGNDLTAMEFVATNELDMRLLFLTGRTMSVLAGVVTVYLVYRTTSRLFGARAALLAAFFLALAPLHVRQSHFAVTDVGAAAFLMASLHAISRIPEGGSLRAYVLAGAFGGLAAATKYFGAFMALSIVAAHFVLVRPTLRRLLPVLFDRRLVAAAGSMIAAFALTSPYSLIEWRTTLSDLAAESWYLKEGYEPKGDIGWLHHAKFTLPFGMGFPVFAMGLAGVAGLLAFEWRRAAWLLAFPIFFYWFAGDGYTVFVRYILPVVPFLAIAAGWSTDRLLILCERRFSPLRLATPVVGLLLVIPAARDIYHFDRLTSVDDTRVLAARWILENHRDIGAFGVCELPYGRVELPERMDAFLRRRREFVPVASREDVESVVKAWFTERGHQGFEASTFDPVRNVFIDFDKQVAPWPPMIIVVRSRHMRLWEALDPVTLTKGRYAKVATFSAFGDDPARARFDLQDAFYLPYARLEDDRRGGPEIDIYLGR